ncbi:signal peptidase I [Sutcliffiella deserti]|uniref:signal peptidase I n=1 Tax=Sutcliffiella deserti TaxID=2875501 RepID=UPI001CBB6008|nr:signal peptidase I [Sutcliffiella deserti]
MGVKLKKVLEDTVLSDIQMDEGDKARFLAALNKPSSTTRHSYKVVFSSVIAACIMFLLVFAFKVDTDTITDPNTSADIPVVETLEEGMELEHYLSDNMDRGNHDFYDELIVVDTKDKDFSRGDIVYYKNEAGRKYLTRIVALEGETLEVVNGQVYIDNKRLDTFYGKAQRLGMEKEEYFTAMDKVGTQYNKEAMLGVFETNMPESPIPEKYLFGMSDDWFRGVHEMVSKEQVIGKVVGVRNK